VPEIGVDDLAEGLVTRGVLLDLPRSLAVRWLEPGHAIRYAELERAEREAGVNVSEGDAVLVRTGRDRREAQTAPNYHEQAGFHPDAMIWAHERGIALFGSDGTNECDPPIAGEGEWPAHVLALVAMGLPLIDNAFLEQLAAMELAEFALLLAPVPLRGGTSSPVNPFALV
jgi:kynurenine formamidase